MHLFEFETTNKKNWYCGEGKKIEKRLFNNKWNSNFHISVTTQLKKQDYQFAEFWAKSWHIKLLVLPDIGLCDSRILLPNYAETREDLHRGPAGDKCSITNHGDRKKTKKSL